MLGVATRARVPGTAGPSEDELAFCNKTCLNYSLSYMESTSPQKWNCNTVVPLLFCHQICHQGTRTWQ